VTTLQDCLLCLCNLADLQLVLPFLKPAHWGQLLHSIQFYQLSLLSTNMPHIVITEFLEYHPGIAFLSINACRVIQGPCPLDGRTLPNLYNVSAPVGCIACLISNNPISHVMTCQFSKADSAPVCSFIPSLLMSTTNLTILQLEVSPTDYTLLDSLVRYIPALRALKLTEVNMPGSVTPTSPRQCWRDAKVWGRKLHHLPHLHDFALCTCLPFTQTPRNTNQEHTVIDLW
ncbi:hypothetical protein EV401DRAFT_1820013, partial [Pisolithus croceorrhizus]